MKTELKIADLTLVFALFLFLAGCNQSSEAPPETNVAAKAEPPTTVQSPILLPPSGEVYVAKKMSESTVIPVVAESDLKTVRDEGTFWSAPGNIVFESSLDIALKKKTNIKSIDISLDHNDVYEVAGFVDNAPILLATIDATSKVGLDRHKIVLKDAVNNVEKIRVTAKSGDGMYSLGHLLVNTQ